jgi:signal transduction histidine kinase
MTLRVRLMALVGTVVVASMAAVFVGSSRLVRLEIEKLEQRTNAPPQGRGVDLRAIRSAITRHYQASGWDGIADVLRELRNHHAPDHELLLVGSGARLIAASQLPAGGLRLSERGPGRVALDYTVQNSPVRLMVGADVETIDGTPASLYVLPPWRQNTEAAPGRVDAWLLLVVAVVGALALAATAVIAHRVVHPLEELHTAVRKMQRGELGGHVAVSSQNEIGKLASAFNAMSAQLARDEVTRRNLMNDVAHELRTPLTRLICTVEAVQDGLRVSDAGAWSSLHADLSLLQRLVEDLQTLALAESGRLPLHVETVDVADSVRRWIQTQPEAEQRRISLELEPGCTFQADPARLQQILANLVRNALLHGGPDVRVSIIARRVAHGVELTVADDGVGISQEYLPYVFDRFYRGDASRARHTGGSGLGLAIVKQLVELHHGTIAVVSGPGGGVTFTITMPHTFT